MLTREELEKREDSYLASYAMKSMNTRGRAHSEGILIEVFIRGIETGLSIPLLSEDWNIKHRYL